MLFEGSLNHYLKCNLRHFVSEIKLFSHPHRGSPDSHPHQTMDIGCLQAHCETKVSDHCTAALSPAATKMHSTVKLLHKGEATRASVGRLLTKAEQTRCLGNSISLALRTGVMHSKWVARMKAAQSSRRRDLLPLLWKR